MPTPPAWIARLANDLSVHLRSMDLLSPLGCHFYHNKALDQWEVSLFASRTEIIGGPFDGRERSSSFQVDLKGVAAIFDAVLQFHWQTHSLGGEDDLGPHIAVEGTYEGRSVWVRVLSESPERFDAGRSFNAYDLRVEDNW